MCDIFNLSHGSFTTTSQDCIRCGLCGDLLTCSAEHKRGGRGDEGDEKRQGQEKDTNNKKGGRKWTKETKSEERYAPKIDEW